MEFKSFAIGYITCMVFDVIFALTNLLLEKAFTYRKLRKIEIKDDNDNEVK